jgi:hypothetical protein
MEVAVDVDAACALRAISSETRRRAQQFELDIVGVQVGDRPNCVGHSAGR